MSQSVLERLETALTDFKPAPIFDLRLRKVAGLFGYSFVAGGFDQNCENTKFG